MRSAWPAGSSAVSHVHCADALYAAPSPMLETREALPETPPAKGDAKGIVVMPAHIRPSKKFQR